MSLWPHGQDFSLLFAIGNYFQSLLRGENRFRLKAENIVEISLLQKNLKLLLVQLNDTEVIPEISFTLEDMYYNYTCEDIPSSPMSPIYLSSSTSSISSSPYASISSNFKRLPKIRPKLPLHVRMPSYKTVATSALLVKQKQKAENTENETQNIIKMYGDRNTKIVISSAVKETTLVKTSLYINRIDTDKREYKNVGKNSNPSQISSSLISTPNQEYKTDMIYPSTPSKTNNDEVCNSLPSLLSSKSAQNISIGSYRRLSLEKKENSESVSVSLTPPVNSKPFVMKQYKGLQPRIGRFLKLDTPPLPPRRKRRSTVHRKLYFESPSKIVKNVVPRLMNWQFTRSRSANAHELHFSPLIEFRKKLKRVNRLKLMAAIAENHNIIVPSIPLKSVESVSFAVIEKSHEKYNERPLPLTPVLM